jgi:hypothetical protein
MGDDVRERLLASYGDMGQAMVAQSVLESGGVPCRVGDLAGLPGHLMGSLGGINRSVGVWVLEPDVERATAMLAATETADGGVDEEALAAAAPGGAVREDEGAPMAAPGGALAARAPGAPPVARVTFLLAVAVAAALLAARGCA